MSENERDFLPPDMPPIPKPDVLDPDRLTMPERDDMTVDDHRSRTDAALRELARTCEYGEALREQLQRVREFLAGAVPSSPHDDAAWNAWRAIYGSVVSAMAGPAGDNGFGYQEAVRIAQDHGSFTDKR